MHFLSCLKKRHFQIFFSSKGRKLLICSLENKVFDLMACSVSGLYLTMTPAGFYFSQKWQVPLELSGPDNSKMAVLGSCISLNWVVDANLSTKHNIFEFLFVTPFQTDNTCSVSSVIMCICCACSVSPCGDM